MAQLSWRAREFIHAPSNRFIMATAVLLIGLLIGGGTLTFTMEYDEVIKVDGQINAKSGLRDFYAPRAGTITDFNFQVGDRIEVDQVVARYQFENSSEQELNQALMALNQFDAQMDTQILSDDVRRPASANPQNQRLQFPLVQPLRIKDQDITRSILDLEHQINTYNDSLIAASRSRQNEALPLKQRLQKLLKRQNELEQSKYSSYFSMERDQLDDEIKKLQTQIAGYQTSGVSRSATLKTDVKTAAQRAAATLQHTLTQSQIRSTLKGVVAKVLVANQSQVGSGQVLLKMIPDQEPLIAEVLIPSKDISKVEIGQKTLIEVSSYPARLHGYFSGQVVSIDRAKTDGAGKVIDHYLVKTSLTPPAGLVNDPKLTLIPGMDLKARIIVKRTTMFKQFLEKVFQTDVISFIHPLSIQVAWADDSNPTETTQLVASCANKVVRRLSSESVVQPEIELESLKRSYQPSLSAQVSSQSSTVNTTRGSFDESVSAVVSVPLWQPELGQQINAQKLQAAQSRFALTAETLSVSLDLIERLSQLQKAKDEKTLIEDQEKRLAEIADLKKEAFRLKVTDSSDYLFSESRTQRITANKVNLEATVFNETRNFKTVFGEALLNRFSNPSYLSMSMFQPVDVIKKIRSSISVPTLPDLLALTASEKSTQKIQDSLNRRLWPALSAEASAGRTFLQQAGFAPFNTYTYAVTVSVDLSSLWRDRGVKREYAHLKKAIRDRMDQTTLESTDRLNQLVTRYENLLLSKKNLEEALAKEEEALKIAKVKVSSGRMPFFDYQLQFLSLFEGKSSLLEVHRSLWATTEQLKLYQAFSQKLKIPEQLCL